MAWGQLEKQKGSLLFTFIISGLISRDVKSQWTELRTGTRRASTSLPVTGWIMPPKDIQVLTPIDVTLYVKRDFVAVISRWEITLWKRRPCDRSRGKQSQKKNLALLPVKME